MFSPTFNHLLLSPNVGIKAYLYHYYYPNIWHDPFSSSSSLCFIHMNRPLFSFFCTNQDKKKNTISLLYTQTTHTRNELRCACVCVHACTCCFVSFLCISKFVFFFKYICGSVVAAELNCYLNSLHVVWMQQTVPSLHLLRTTSLTNTGGRTYEKESFSFLRRCFS